MKRVEWSQLRRGEQSQLLARPAADSADELYVSVRRILDQVKADGDIALRALTRRFDAAQLQDLRVSTEEFERAEESLPDELKLAIEQAFERISKWHAAGASVEFEVETAPGVSCGRIIRPIRAVGLYVPAGSAPLPSTALMLGVPAGLAGCAQIILCTPPNAQGQADPAVLYVAKRCGISQVFKLGGAQAMAAMAYGTNSVPICDKLFGPDNRWVTAAKQLLSAEPNGPAIDMPAGPSEVLVIADGSANAEFVAADLLSQIEHGPDSQAILLTDSDELLEACKNALTEQVARLPRANIITESIHNVRLIRCDDIESAIQISNGYGPEHLILSVEQPRLWLDRVQSAGSVFLGNYAPESVGDYCSGTNHVLPTGGATRAYSGVSLASFQRMISIQELSAAGLQGIGNCAVTLARAEGLEAHAQSVLLRMASI